MISSKVAALLAYVGGTLLILAGATGSVGIIGTILEFLIDNLGGTTADVLSLFLQILNFVADLGGAAVIIGGALILNERITTGKLVITLGAGMGLFGFLLTLASAFFNGWASAISFIYIVTHSIGWIGIVLAIAATRIARKPKKE